MELMLRHDPFENWRVMVYTLEPKRSLKPTIVFSETVWLAGVPQPLQIMEGEGVWR